MKKMYSYKVEMPNNDKYFIEKRLSGYYVSFESYDKKVYYSIYGVYKKLGTACNKLQDITKDIAYRVNYHCSAADVDKYVISVYGF